MARNVIPGFSKLTPAQVIRMALFHILKTKKQCRINNKMEEACSYAGSGCAAAPFLTKSARTTLAASWGGLVSNGKVPPENAELIQKIQQCHDTYHEAHADLGLDFVGYFVGGMRAIAAEYGVLSYDFSDMLRQFRKENSR